MLKKGLRLSAVVVGISLTGAYAESLPQRIVSTNLCADQFLALISDHNRIAGLSPFARDKVMSAYADIARTLPSISSTVEDVLYRKPDLVVASEKRKTGVTAELAAYGLPILYIRSTHSLNDIYLQIRVVAKALHRQDRGEQIIRDMKVQLEDLPNPPARKLVAAYYQRRGYVTGTGTLVDDMMTRAGLINLADRLGKESVAQLSLEDIVYNQPDVLIVESEALEDHDQGAEMLDHPAIAHIPKVTLPQSWTVCGSPKYVDAVKGMIAQTKSLR